MKLFFLKFPRKRRPIEPNYLKSEKTTRVPPFQKSFFLLIVYVYQRNYIFGTKLPRPHKRWTFFIFVKIFVKNFFLFLSKFFSGKFFFIK